MNEEYTVSYLDENYDLKLFFYPTKEEAEEKFKEILTNKKYKSPMIMTKEEYEEMENDSLDNDD